MGGKNKGGGGENSKKAQGQARKADAAAGKKAAKDQQVEAAEASNWEKGAKSNAKAYVVPHALGNLLSTALTKEKRGRCGEGC